MRWLPRRFNERTGTPFNELQFPTDVVLAAIRAWLAKAKGDDLALLLRALDVEVTVTNDGPARDIQHR